VEVQLQPFLTIGTTWGLVSRPGHFTPETPLMLWSHISRIRREAGAASRHQRAAMSLSRGQYRSLQSVEWYDEWPNGDTIPVFCLEELRKTTKTVLITIAGVLAEIRTVSIPIRAQIVTATPACSMCAASLSNQREWLPANQPRATHVTRANGPFPLLRYPGAR
jgi:hypothetical protein